MIKTLGPFVQTVHEFLTAPYSKIAANKVHDKFISYYLYSDLQFFAVQSFAPDLPSPCAHGTADLISIFQQENFLLKVLHVFCWLILLSQFGTQ